MSKLIVIEGALDGIGKTTQTELLKKRFEKENKKVFTHHFPSDDKYGDLVHEYLDGKFGDKSKLSPYFVHSLYAVDRAVSMNVLKNEIEENDIAIFDRYTQSSLIYQCCNLSEEEKIKFIDFAMDYEYSKLGVPKPDKMILLLAPFDEIIKMKQKRNENKKEDIHERDIDFLKKVYDNALFVAKYLNWDIVNCFDNKMRSKEEIHEEIYNKIK